MSSAVVTMLTRTHIPDTVAVDASVLLLFADLQAVAMFGIVDFAVSRFLFPPCYLCCLSSLSSEALE